MPFVPGIFSDAIQGPIPDESLADSESFSGNAAALAGTATDLQTRVWTGWRLGTLFVTGLGTVGLFGANTSAAGVINISGRTPDVTVAGFTGTSNDAQYGATVLGVDQSNFLYVAAAGSSDFIVTKMSGGVRVVLTSTTTGVSTGDLVVRDVRARVDWPWIRGYWSGAATSTISYQLVDGEQITYMSATRAGIWLQHTAGITSTTFEDA
jgi:hypothetical protein